MEKRNKILLITGVVLASYYIGLATQDRAPAEPEVSKPAKAATAPSKPNTVPVSVNKLSLPEDYADEMKRNLEEYKRSGTLPATMQWGRFMLDSTNDEHRNVMTKIFEDQIAKEEKAEIFRQRRAEVEATLFGLAAGSDLPSDLEFSFGGYTLDQRSRDRLQAVVNSIKETGKVEERVIQEIISLADSSNPPSEPIPVAIGGQGAVPVNIYGEIPEAPAAVPTDNSTYQQQVESLLE